MSVAAFLRDNYASICTRSYDEAILFGTISSGDFLWYASFLPGQLFFPGPAFFTAPTNICLLGRIIGTLLAYELWQ